MPRLGHDQPLFDNRYEPILFQGDQSFEPKPTEEPSHFIAPKIKAPTKAQQKRMESYSDQMSGIQAARAAGVKDYIPSALPDAAVEPEKAREIVIDRRKLGNLGKLAADQAPARVLKDLRDRL